MNDAFEERARKMFGLPAMKRKLDPADGPATKSTATASRGATSDSDDFETVGRRALGLRAKQNGR